jgi:hypothetical protein
MLGYFELYRYKNQRDAPGFKPVLLLFIMNAVELLINHKSAENAEGCSFTKNYWKAKAVKLKSFLPFITFPTFDMSLMTCLISVYRRTRPINFWTNFLPSSLLRKKVERWYNRKSLSRIIKQFAKIFTAADLPFLQVSWTGLKKISSS